MEITKQFENEIAPFFWAGNSKGASACLNVGGYLQELFDTRADEGSCRERSALTLKQICSVPIQRIRKLWRILFSVSGKRVVTKP